MGSGAKLAPELERHATFNPRWVIDCWYCLASFIHSEIWAAETLGDHPTKPEFPATGLELECPYCKNKAIYTREDLRHRHD